MSADGAAKRKIAEAKAALIQLQLEEKRANLIPTTEATNAIVSLNQIVKQRLLSISTRLVPRIVTAMNADEAKRMIDAEIHLALTELSETPKLRPKLIDEIVGKATEN